jgi:hypothetical protein
VCDVFCPPVSTGSSANLPLLGIRIGKVSTLIFVVSSGAPRRQRGARQQTKRAGSMICLSALLDRSETQALHAAEKSRKLFRKIGKVSKFDRSSWTIVEY